MFIFPNNAGKSQMIILVTTCLCNYPLTVYCVSYPFVSVNISSNITAIAIFGQIISDPTDLFLAELTNGKLSLCDQAALLSLS